MWGKHGFPLSTPFLKTPAASSLTRAVPTLVCVSATEFETLPSIGTDAVRPQPGVVVMKFGGTSVADPERIVAVARRLAGARDSSVRVVGVLSAMGDTTDELLDLARRVSPRPQERELDMLVSVGERVSCALAAMALIELGYGAVSLTGSQAGIVTDTAHGKAKIVEVRGRRIHEALDAGSIVLVAGFQGVSTDAEVTTLGRGGSDTTAVALAAALGADVCEIYSDVEGVFTADPRVVSDARKLRAVTYDEMLELAASGARVLQLRSVEFARSYGVRMHVRSSFSDDEGTWVTTENDERMLEKAIISGVAHTVDEHVYRVDGVPAARLFAALANANVSVDTILHTGGEVVFSAPSEDQEATRRTLDELGAKWTEDDELGKVSVVGAGMKSHPGVAATTFATLDELAIEPLVVSTSPIKITCHVRRSEVDRAVAALHDAFGLARNGEAAA
jgi:aspartate kinase